MAVWPILPQPAPYPPAKIEAAIRLHGHAPTQGTLVPFNLLIQMDLCGQRPLRQAPSALALGSARARRLLAVWCLQCPVPRVGVQVAFSASMRPMGHHNTTGGAVVALGTGRRHR